MPTDTRWLNEVTGQSPAPMNRGLNPYTHWEQEAETSAEEHFRQAQEGQKRDEDRAEQRQMPQPV